MDISGQIITIKPDFNVALLRVLHREWFRKVTVIYHNSDLDDYFGRHRQNRRKKFSPLSKLQRPVLEPV